MKIPNLITKTLTNEKSRNVITKLRDPNSLMPVILLEATVTGGRTLQAYKRGGYTEARERLCEESIGAVFWLFGVKMFNKIGDMFGKHVLKIPETEFDVGKDALRTPFDNMVEKLAKDSEAATKAGKSVKAISKNALAGFKFGKIILSILAATSFIGFVVPKFNQSITRKVISKNKHGNETSQPADSNTQSKSEQHNSTVAFSKAASIEDFKNKVTNKGVAFKGGFINPEMLATMAHNLENHPIYKLLATDTGIVTGRTLNARNADERIEIPFRDGSSIYFYLFCTNHIISGLEKALKFGNIAKLDPSSAKLVHELMLNSLSKSGGSMSVEDFQKNMLGSLSDSGKQILDNVFDKKEVVALDDFLSRISDDVLKEKARKISTLQPEQAKLGAVISKMQATDVLKEAEISDSDFLLKAYKQAFNTIKDGKEIDNLRNPYKYIPMSRIESFRSHIDDYVNTVIDYAKKMNKDVVDETVLKTMNTKNMVRYGGFFATGFLVSAAFLSTIIPKTQYLITKLRTGKNEFPGLEADGIKQK